MPDPIEALVTRLLDADAKMTKGPWKYNVPDRDLAGETRVEVLADMVGDVPACKPFDPNPRPVELTQAKHDFQGIALLRNSAPLIAEVIRELAAGMQELAALSASLGDNGINRCAHEHLAKIAKRIEEHNAH